MRRDGLAAVLSQRATLVSWARMISALVALILFAACNPGPYGGPGNLPLAFPWAGKLGASGQTAPYIEGDTIGVVIDSNYIPFWEDYESYTLHRDNTRVKVGPWGGTSGPEIEPRAVFELGLSPSSYRGAVQRGAWFTVVLFDLPRRDQVPGAPLSGTFQAKIEVLINGVLRQTTSFMVLGGAGSPNPIANSEYFGSLLTEMGPGRMVRLRPKVAASQGAPGFSPGMPAIGAIQFDLVFQTACADGIFSADGILPYGNSEAARATAIAGPAEEVDATHSRTRIVLVDPAGFALTFSQGPLAGQGPLLDLVFEPIPKPSGCTFDQNQFALENLLVTDLNGDALIEEPDPGTDYFASYILTPPP